MIHKSWLWLEKNPGILLITLIYLVIIVLMLPMRNLAFEDDFAYIQTAEHLYKTGELKISEWSATSLVFQTYLGVLFTKIFGFSIKALIFSNIVLLYFALIAFYVLLRKLLCDEKRAILFTLFLLGFPWVLNYAYSFMSDVFYMSLKIISSCFYVLGFSYHSSQNKKVIIILFTLGSIFAGFAFLNRQIGALIMLSAVVIQIYQNFCNKKFTWEYYLPIIVPSAFIILLYLHWLNQTGMTYAQNKYFGYKAKNDLILSLWPARAEYTYICHQFFLEILQRALGLLNQLMGFTFPILLIFTFSISSIFKIVQKNILQILTFLFVIISMFLIDAFIPDPNHKLRYTQSSAREILYTDSIFGYSDWWPKIILISTPIWTVIIAVTFNRAFRSMVEKRKIVFHKIYLYSMISILLLSISHFFQIYQKTLITVPHSVNRLTSSILLITPQNVALIPLFNEILVSTWLFFLTYITIGLLLVFFFTHLTIRFNQKINYSIIFLGISLLLELASTIIGGYFYWQNYVIQFIPLIIIFLAYFFRKVQIDYKRALLATAFLLFLSLEITRNRYQSQGARWELGTELINKGVNITSITTVSWAWRPYWLFESNLQKSLKEVGGNRYNLDHRIGSWEIGYAPGNIIDIIEIGPHQLEEIKRTEKVLLVSNPYWTFKDQFIAVAVERNSN